MLILAWFLIRAFGRLLAVIGDDLLVIAHLKWRDSMGRARWS